MNADWLMPDPDELEPPHWRNGHMPAIGVTDRRMVAYRMRHALLLPKGKRRTMIEKIAAYFSIDPRTAYRYARERFPCPGPRCMTLVRGGGLCEFCKKIPMYEVER